MKKQYSVPALEKAMAILDLLGSTTGTHTATEIHTTLGLPKASTFMILNVLERYQMVKRSTGNRYTIGLRAYELGTRYLASLDIVEVARPHLEALVERTRLTAHLGVLQGKHLIYADKAESGGMIRFSTFTGMRADIHTSSLGKAIAAHMPKADLRALLGGTELGAYTPNTITSFTALLAELERIRARGYAVENEEGELGVRCVGAPIWDDTGRVVAAISVTGVLSQIPHERIEPLGAEVMAAANAVSRELGFRDEADVKAESQPEPGLQGIEPIHAQG
jgi:IclR family acetate operon transcriptional repressor